MLAETAAPKRGGGVDGDWQADAPTERQLRYIEVLGGDPSSVRTKGQARELIDRRRRLRRGSPLDPVRLEDRAVKVGKQVRGDWQSAHLGLLSDLRLRLQEYVDSTMASLRTKLSNPVGSESSRNFRNPDDLVHDAEEELTRLELWRGHGKDVGSLGFWNAKSGGQESEQSSDDASQGQFSTDESSSPWMVWFWIVVIFLALLVAESFANIRLLMDALPGGALDAFLLAALVSAINVGGIGIGFGLLLARLRRHFGDASTLFRLACVAWPIMSVTFNYVAGRHRAAYSLVADAVQENPNASRVVGQYLADVSFNPFVWDFQSLLFATLGFILCCAGLAKGFSSFSSTREGPGASQPAASSGEAEIRNPDEELFAHYESLPERYQHEVDSIRKDVADWYTKLDEERRNVHSTVENLKEEQHRQACINFVEYWFVSSYNSCHPDKITLDRLEKHRLNSYPEPLSVKPSDPGVLEEAATVVADWTAKGQSDYDERVLTARSKIRDLWNDYRDPVLGTSNAG